ncbi:MAG TPA: LacI family DNA-binding transcriptional regulator [Steroidobacteraceae bacterium]|nr:LacI family DNA-binding transcriptional regulator [Steroidobacteraceae bacterium]
MPTSKSQARTRTSRTKKPQPVPRETELAPSVATLDAVARAAEVSSATVSRFFNSPAMLSARTAQRVRDAVERLGYIPNLLAGGLASSRTRLVAAVIPEISQSLFASTIQSLSDTLAEKGYGVMLGLTGARDEHVERQILSIIGRRPEGIILTGANLSLETRRRLKSSEITTIETWDLPPEPVDLVVGFSHEAVGRAVALHALKAGRRRAFVASATGVRALARRYGFAKAMLEGGASEPVVAAFASPTTYRYGRTAVAAHLEGGGRPDIIICSSDWSAHGALDELRSREIKVPDDIAVIGFGDLEFASDIEPSLTTVKIDGHVIGLKAAEFLLRRTQGQRIDEPVVDIGFTLVRRASG